MDRGEALEAHLARLQRDLNGAGASGGLNLLLRASVRHEGLDPGGLGLPERRLPGHSAVWYLGVRAPMRTTGWRFRAP